MADTDDAPWPNTETTVASDATTIKELMERSTDMGVTRLNGIVADLHGKRQYVIRRAHRQAGQIVSNPK
ncbi:hypothetical protein [Prosthecobacter sp.]|uniref:hypothetical protein n=1 Tax=Prosthecobacter sp. TaxID=1965333 RepID=UPI001D2BBB44|nr:hypothetical protein [Prosthecobacter sp.]MCB1275159.1 hypothetical protein [Prosthecobacter sp.]